MLGAADVAERATAAATAAAWVPVSRGVDLLLHGGGRQRTSWPGRSWWIWLTQRAIPPTGPWLRPSWRLMRLQPSPRMRAEKAAAALERADASLKAQNAVVAATPEASPGGPGGRGRHGRVSG